MEIEVVKNSDIDNWLELVQEVEPLFGPIRKDAKETVLLYQK